MIDREHAFALVRQAQLAGLSRGAIYYEPKALPERDLLNPHGAQVGRKHVVSLMRRMGGEAILSY